MRKNLEQSAGFGGKSISSNHQALEYIFASGQFPLHWSLVGCSSAPKQEIEWNRYIQETCFSNTSIYSQHSGLSASVTSTSQTSISPKKTKKAGICHFGTLHLVSMPPRELHPLTFPVPVPFTGLTEAPGDSKVKLPCVVTCRTEKRNCSYTAKKSVEAWRDLLNGKFMSVSLDISTRTVVKSFGISHCFVKEKNSRKHMPQCDTTTTTCSVVQSQIPQNPTPPAQIQGSRVNRARCSLARFPFYYLGPERHRLKSWGFQADRHRIISPSTLTLQPHPNFMATPSV